MLVLLPSLSPPRACRCQMQWIEAHNDKQQTDRRGSELSQCAAPLIKIFACNLCQHCGRGADDLPFPFHPSRAYTAGKLRRRTEQAALTSPNWIRPLPPRASTLGNEILGAFHSPLRSPDWSAPKEDLSKQQGLSPVGSQYVSFSHPLRRRA